MKRSNWLFKVSKEVLIKATQEKVSYHKGRRKYWMAEKRKAEKSLRADGIEFKEQQITGGTRMDVIGRQDLLNRYNEATGKINSHTTDMETYERWERALTLADPKQMFELEIDDISHFGL